MTALSLCNCKECPLGRIKGIGPILGEGTKDLDYKDYSIWQDFWSFDTPLSTVLDSDHRFYKVVFVAMAPAWEELQQGRVLVGRSGRLLRATLSKLGLKDFYLTNTLLCMLPDGLSSSRQNKAIECCKARLLQEIRGINPELVVALGNMPLDLLTGLDIGVKSVEGRVLPSIDEVDQEILAVTHPAAVLRRTEEFFDFVDSLKSGMRWLDGTYMRASKPKTVVVDDSNIAEILQTIENAGTAVVDLETTGKGFFPYDRDPDKIRCTAIAFNKETCYIFPGKSSPHFEPHEDYSEHPGLKEVINKIRPIFHNSLFDMGFLLQAGYKPKVFYDTFLAHYMLDEREWTHGLKLLSRKHLGAPDWAEDIKTFLPNKKSSYDLIPDEELYQYTSYDACYNFQLYDEWLRHSVNGGVFSNLIMPCTNMFAQIRHRGILIDPVALMALDGDLDRDLNNALDELEELVGHVVSPFSPHEVAELLYDEMKLPVLKRYGRSTNKKALEYYRGSPVVEKILECRELGKLKSTYVMSTASFVDWDFLIHPLTKIHGTVTGRISTEDPSVMNITKKGGIKKIYLPRPGRWILDADQRQMELRCYSVIARDKFLMKMILEGKDPHNIIVQEVTRRLKKTITRGAAKTGVFGRLYGRGLESFIWGFGLRKPDAMAVIGIIDDMFPSLKEYNQGVKDEIHEKGELASFFKRKRRFGLITDENRHECYRQGSNFKVQSMASDVNLYCMLDLWENKERLGVHPLFPVHDSIVMEIEDKDCIPLIRDRIRQYSRELVGGFMEFDVDLRVGKTWGDLEAWSD